MRSRAAEARNCWHPPKARLMITAFPDADAALATVRQAEGEWMVEFGAPRDPDLVGRYLASTLPAGRYVIYGAGTQSERLLAALETRSDVEITGFLDRRAAALPMFHGRPVVAAEQLATLSCDGFILSHYWHERSMRDRLLALGVAADRITAIYSDQGFARWSLDAFRDRIEALPIREIRHLVVTCAESQWSLLSNADLARFLPSDHTLHAYFGRPEAFAGNRVDRVFPTIDLHQSLLALNTLIEAAKPRSIYLKSSVYHHGQFLGAYLKLRYPAIRVVQEMYDQALLLTDYKLIHGFDYDAPALIRLRAAERVAFERCDLVVAKNGGSAWQSILAGFAAPSATYFPRVTGKAVPAPPPPDPEARCRIVFAGTLPPPSSYAEGREQLDISYTAMFERMPSDDRFRVDLYNGAHMYPGHDETYAAYRAMFPPDGNMRYFPALSLAELQATLPKYDYGWHVLHENLHAVEPVSRVGIGNKFTTYLQAGLPVLTDSGFDFMVELIETHGAGLVVAPDAVAADLKERLAGTDVARFRPGVIDLVQHMARVNAETETRIAGVMLG
jgi:hypothetical protein